MLHQESINQVASCTDCAISTSLRIACLCLCLVFLFFFFSSLADLPVAFLRVAFHVIYLSVGCIDQGAHCFQDNRLFQLFECPHCLWSFLRQWLWKWLNNQHLSKISFQTSIPSFLEIIFPLFSLHIKKLIQLSGSHRHLTNKVKRSFFDFVFQIRVSDTF